MATQSQEGNLERKSSILEIDYTSSHVATLLAAQSSDKERYALAEKIIIELINKHKEQKDLLENNEKLLKEQKDLLETKDNERKELLSEHRELLDNNENYFMSKKTCYMKENNYLS